MPEAIVPKVGHGPKMGQNGFDRACISVVFLFLLCFIAHSYEATGGTDMEVLACFRPGFFIVLETNREKNTFVAISNGAVPSGDQKKKLAPGYYRL